MSYTSCMVRSASSDDPWATAGRAARSPRTPRPPLPRRSWLIARGHLARRRRRRRRPAGRPGASRRRNSWCSTGSGQHERAARQRDVELERWRHWVADECSHRDHAGFGAHQRVGGCPDVVAPVRVGDVRRHLGDSPANSRIMSSMWIPWSRRIPPPATSRLVRPVGVEADHLRLAVDALEVEDLAELAAGDDALGPVADGLVVAVVEAVLQLQAGWRFLGLAHGEHVLDRSPGGSRRTRAARARARRSSPRRRRRWSGRRRGRRAPRRAAGHRRPTRDAVVGRRGRGEAPVAHGDVCRRGWRRCADGGCDRPPIAGDADPQRRGPPQGAVTRSRACNPRRSEAVGEDSGVHSVADVSGTRLQQPGAVVAIAGHGAATRPAPRICATASRTISSTAGCSTCRPGRASARDRRCRGTRVETSRPRCSRGAQTGLVLDQDPRELLVVGLRELCVQVLAGPDIVDPCVNGAMPALALRGW